MKEKTVARGIRIPESDMIEIQGRIAKKKKKMSFNQWINWAVKNGLRSHKGRDTTSPLT